MAFWNYIGEFFLFRWLFGKFKKSATKHDAHTEDLGASIDRDGKHLNVNHDEDIVPIDDAVIPVGDNLLDDSDNSEELDDLDIFMRNNIIRKTKRSLKIKRSDSEPKTKRSLNRFLFVLVSSFFEGHILCVSCLRSFC